MQSNGSPRESRSGGRGAVVTFLIRHQSLLLAPVFGAVVFVALTSRQATAENLLTSWNGTALFYLSLTWYRMIRSTVGSIKKRAADLDFSDFVLLLLASAAAIASIVGIGLELHQVKDAPADIALARAGTAFVTILISWLFLHTLFTVHYAHHFYSDRGGEGGLKFPEEPKEPVYWDFLYFSFTIGVAAQTADVEITSMPMRRFALLHAVLSFLFNTTILALAINVGASLL